MQRPKRAGRGGPIPPAEPNRRVEEDATHSEETGIASVADALSEQQAVDQAVAYWLRLAEKVLSSDTTEPAA